MKRPFNSLLRRGVSMATCAAVIATVAACGDSRQPVDYVNNRIGNISHLLVPTYPTTHLPNSMLRMIPDHNEFTTDRMGGLPLNVPSHRNGSVLMMMPYCGPAEGLHRHMSYRYDQEHSSPTRYTVYLDDYGIVTDFVPAAKAAIFSCTFEQPGDRYIQVTSSGGEIHGEGNAMWGYDNYRGIKQYFYLEFDTAPEAFATAAGDVNSARFAATAQRVTARYGISYIDVEQARRNLRAEIASWDMDAMERDARTAWNDALGRIEVEGGTDDQKTTFYTALYRCHERMVCISEDGRYFSAFDGKVHDDGGTPFWTDDWVWDTYHALHPLQTILNPRAQEQKIESYLRMYEQSGWMPTFPCVFGDAHCMNGNHSAAVFADALCKGLEFDVKRAFEGIRHTVLNETMLPWVRAPKTELDDFYHANGWFPALHPGEQETVAAVSGGERRQSVAVTLAASYDDWCISRLAQHMGLGQEYDFHLRRSFNYRNLFNRETGFFHPKDDKGEFIQPFDYIFSGGLGARDYYDENNAWTYIWDVHHNIADLISLFGGEQPFADKLDQLFAEGLHTSKWQYYSTLPDSSGNVGQYVMGNEPSFHIPYLYNYARRPWQTQKRIRMLMESWFRNDLMGICGDEDGGGMSAFYVFSAMGFYPVTAGMPYYVIGSPIFDRVTIHLDGGKTFTLIARNNSADNKYIQSATLNGRPYDKSYFSHEDLMAGGTLELVMGDRPCKTWAVTEESVPPSEGSELRPMSGK